MTIKAIVTDVEGTTSDIDFVHQCLFPYARERIPQFIADHAEDAELRQYLAMVVAETDLQAGDLAGIAERLQHWIDEDLKHTALKAVQGMIWREGFEQEVFKAHVFPDAVHYLRRWHAAGLALYVYSSGSVAAQRLYFKHSAAGDLSDLFSGHYDTTSGAKRAAESYQKIAVDIGLKPAELLFLSDTEAELDAAKAAGWHTVQVVREGALPSDRHLQVSDFGGVALDSVDPDPAE